MRNHDGASKKYLLVSDFDQTLSFHDSGSVLSEILGIADFPERIAGLEQIHLVQQGENQPTCCCTTPSSAGCAGNI